LPCGTGGATKSRGKQWTVDSGQQFTVQKSHGFFISGQGQGQWIDGLASFTKEIENTGNVKHIRSLAVKTYMDCKK
jgi:hypothetical protein